MKSIKFIGILVLAIFVAGGAAAFDARVGFYVASVLAGIPALAVLRPMPKLMLSSRWLALAAFLLFGLPIALNAHKAMLASDEAALAELKQTNPSTYLAQLERLDPEGWLSELAVMDPARFVVEKACSDALKAKAALIAKHKAQAKFAALAADQCGTKNESLAFVMSQDAVRKRLRAPSTAVFSSWPEDYSVKRTEDCRFVVSSYVDAQNGFGAMLRMNYVAVMHLYPESGGWVAENVQIDG